MAEQQPEPSGAITWLWLCSACIGNLFALYWLGRAVLLQHPGIAPNIRQWAMRWRKHSSNHEEDATGSAPSSGVLQPAHRLSEGSAVNNTAAGPAEALAHSGNAAAQITEPRAAEGTEPASFEQLQQHDELELVDAVLSRQLGSISTVCTAGSSVSAAVLSSSGTPAAHEEGGDCAALRDLPASCVLDMHQPQAEAVKLEWRSLSYEVQQGSERKQLLSGVWGSVGTGQLLALLGPSGAGKSTLLEILTRRKAPSGGERSVTNACHQATPGHSTHNLALPSGLFLNGVPVTAEQMQQISSFIPQDDVLLPQMTVWETLQLHAALRLPPGVSDQVRTTRQQEVMSAMGLNKQKHTVVGGDLPGGLMLRGLSGGERKRLAICTGLLPHPQVLFADEPTSGLDAFAALTVMAHLAATARGPRGCAVVASIHQPRAAIWDMIDKALLLARGHMVFEGPVEGMLPWLGHTLPPLLGIPCSVPPFAYNPETHGTLSDWAIDLVGMSDVELLEQLALPAVSQPGSLTVQISTTSATAQLSARDCDQFAVTALPVMAQPGSATWISRAAELFLARYLSRARGSSGGGSAVSSRGVPRAQSREYPAGPVVMTTDASWHGLSGGDAVAAPSSPAPRSCNGDESCPGDDGMGEVVVRAGSHHQQVITTVALASHLHTQLPGHLHSATPAHDDAASSTTHQSSTWSGRWSTWWCQYKVLVWREALASVRNPADVAGRMLTFVWVALLGNFLLYGGSSEKDTAGSIRIRLAWLYFTLFFYMVMPFLFMSVFTADKRVYLSDVAAALYKPGSYYAAKLTASLPLNMFISLAFLLTAYGMFGFRHTALAVVQVSAISVVFSLISLQWIFFATAISPNQDIAFVLAVGFAVVNLLINGLFLGPMETAGLPWMRYLRYLSAMDYAWQGVAAAELHGRVFHCSAGGPVSVGLDALGLFPQFLPDTGQISIIKYGLSAPIQGCLANADVVLRHYEVRPAVGASFGWILIYLAVLHLATYAALKVATARAVRVKVKDT